MISGRSTSVRIGRLSEPTTESAGLAAGGFFSSIVLHSAREDESLEVVALEPAGHVYHA